jgi:hypothetical protein
MVCTIVADHNTLLLLKRLLTHARRSGTMSSNPEIDRMLQVGNLPGVVEALADPQLRQAASEAPIGIGSPAVPPLVAALGHVWCDLRKAAALTLGEIRDKDSLPALIRALRDKDWAVREAAVIALGKLQDSAALDPLCQALLDSDEWVRQRAAQVLGELGDPDAMEALIAARQDRDELLVKHAEEAIRAIRARS